MSLRAEEGSEEGSEGKDISRGRKRSSVKRGKAVRLSFKLVCQQNSPSAFVSLSARDQDLLFAFRNVITGRVSLLENCEVVCRMSFIQLGFMQHLIAECYRK